VAKVSPFKLLPEKITVYPLLLKEVVAEGAVAQELLKKLLYFSLALVVLVVSEVLAVQVVVVGLLIDFFL
jgi:hypothetical protein